MDLLANYNDDSLSVDGSPAPKKRQDCKPTDASLEDEWSSFEKMIGGSMDSKDASDGATFNSSQYLVGGVVSYPGMGPSRPIETTSHTVTGAKPSLSSSSSSVSGVPALGEDGISNADDEEEDDAFFKMRQQVKKKERSSRSGSSDSSGTSSDESDGSESLGGSKGDEHEDDEEEEEDGSEHEDEEEKEEPRESPVPGQSSTLEVTEESTPAESGSTKSLHSHHHSRDHGRSRRGSSRSRSKRDHGSRSKKRRRSRSKSRDRKRRHSRERRRHGKRSHRRSSDRKGSDRKNKERRHRERSHSPGRERKSSHSEKHGRDRESDRRRSRSRSKERRRERSKERKSGRERTDSRRSRSRHRSRSRDRSHERLRSRSPQETRMTFKERMRQELIAASRLSEKEMQEKSTTDQKATPGEKLKAAMLKVVSTSGSGVTPQMALLQTMAVMHERAQEITGVAVPKYYNPAAVNPLKYAEQVQKRKLLWSKNKDVDKEKEVQKESQWKTSAMAANADGKMTTKFLKLMGMKDEEIAKEPELDQQSEEQKQKQNELFNRLDKEYEFARMTTHTHRGIGLGFQSQGFPNP